MEKEICGGESIKTGKMDTGGNAPIGQGNRTTTCGIEAEISRLAQAGKDNSGQSALGLGALLDSFSPPQFVDQMFKGIPPIHVGIKELVDLAALIEHGGYDEALCIVLGWIDREDV